MARLTLSEQVNALSSEKAELTAKLAADASLIQSYRDTQARLNVELDTLRDLPKRVEELEKDLKNAKLMRELYEKSSAKAESEIEQAHAVLDGVVGAPSREYDGNYGKLQRNVVTRLAGAFLAIARNGGVK